MGTGYPVRRRDVLRAALLGAVVAVPLASACGPADETEHALVAPWRSARADLALLDSVRAQYAADAPQGATLVRLADARTVHRDALAVAIAADGGTLPAESTGTAAPASPPETTDPSPTSASTASPSSASSAGGADLRGLLAALRSSADEAAAAAGGLTGYPAALAASVAAGCAAAAEVELALGLGVAA